MQLYQILLTTGLLACGAAAHAQSIGPSTIDAAGSSVTVGGNTFEYAIGQVMDGSTLNAGSSVVITPDVIQPASTTGVNDNTIGTNELQVFPSPVETTLFLKPAFNGGGSLQYKLFDAAGKLVLSKEARLQLGNEQQELDVAKLAVGQYTLQVVWNKSNTAYTAGYKIQKLK
jgi:hypothetical protein